MINQKVLEKFQKHNFKEWELEELQTFFKAKAEYMENKCVSALSAMKMAYSPIYFTVKHAWVRGEITKETFDELIDLLQEGLE